MLVGNDRQKGYGSTGRLSLYRAGSYGTSQGPTILGGAIIDVPKGRLKYQVVVLSLVFIAPLGTGLKVVPDNAVGRRGRVHHRAQLRPAISRSDPLAGHITPANLFPDGFKRSIHLLGP